MRHNLKFRKLNRTSAHRKSMLINMASSLIEHESITTTLPKAKALRPFIERLITKGRDSSLASRRILRSILRRDEVVTKLLNDVSPRYMERKGGYTRILKLSVRRGDNSPMSVISLVD